MRYDTLAHECETFVKWGRISDEFVSERCIFRQGNKGSDELDLRKATIWVNDDVCDRDYCVTQEGLERRNCRTLLFWSQDNNF